MSITYRQHQDTRDGKIYNCVLMPDGKWWSAENLAWDGAGGLYYANNPANAFLGRLYPDPNTTGDVAPSGSHTPTIADWNALQTAIGNNNCNRTMRSNFGWYSIQGEDTYGFRVLGGGFGYNGGATWAAGGDGIGAAYFTILQVIAGAGKCASRNFYTDNQEMCLVSDSNGTDDILKYVRFIVDVFNEPPTPSIYPASGTYQGVQFATISASSGTIRYTLDGTEPTASSPVYTRPIRIQDGMTIKAVVDYGAALSVVASATYSLTGNKIQAISSYQDAVLPLLLEQYKGDNP